MNELMKIQMPCYPPADLSSDYKNIQLDLFSVFPVEMEARPRTGLLPPALRAQLQFVKLLAMAFCRNISKEQNWTSSPLWVQLQFVVLPEMASCRNGSKDQHMSAHCLLSS